jgi:hypothetical protein
VTVEDIIRTLFDAARYTHGHPEASWVSGECRRAAEAVCKLAREKRRLEDKCEKLKCERMEAWIDGKLKYE